MSVVVLVLVATVSSSARTCQSSGSQIDVLTAVGDTNCTHQSLNEALKNVRNDTVIVLYPGEHRLTDFRLIENSFNVTLVGAGSKEEVNITCSKNVGLAFINSSTLTFRNLTITKCGLSGQALLDTVANIRDNFYTVPSYSRVALLIGTSYNVELEAVTVANTDGIGLLTMNTLGLKIRTSDFLSNSPTECFVPTNQGGIGGGAIIMYFQDNENLEPEGQLSVLSSSFKFNSNCNSESNLQWYVQYTSFRYAPNATYVIGGGGGLSVFIARYSSHVSIKVQDCYFQNNTAQFGGGVLINIFEGVSNFSLLISNTKFTSNGVSDTSYSIGSTSGGSGIALLKGIQYFSAEDVPPIANHIANSVLIRGCYFEDNIAYSAGAILLQSQYRTPKIPATVYIDNCYFKNNSAYLGAVSIINEFKSNGAQEGMDVIFHDCSFSNNSLLSPVSGFLSNTVQSSSIIAVVAMNITFRGNSIFANNYGTPVQTISTILNIQGTMHVLENVGAMGGGLSLTSSTFLVLHNNTEIKFQNNTAYVGGGAIFVNYDSVSTIRGLVYYDCFLFFDELNAGCLQYDTCQTNLLELNITIIMDSNDAPLGTAVYGSTIETCQWLAHVRNVSGSDNTGFDLLVDIGILKVTPPLNESNKAISTPSYILQSNEFNISDLSIMPGEMVHVNMTAIDRLKVSVPTAITSIVLDSKINGEFTSLLGSSGYWFLDRQAHDLVPITILSQHEPESVEIATVGLYSIDSEAQIVLTVLIQPCYLGFVFSNVSNRNHHRCECSAEIQANEIPCDADSGIITIHSGFWVGNVTADEIAVSPCYARYCLYGTKNITRGNFDSQCVDNRAGIVCASCKENYSITFGNGGCMQCSNYFLFTLIVYAVAGILLMYQIGWLDATISHGLINSVLFFSNILTIYQPFLVRQSLYLVFLPMFVPFSWLNLSLGFPLCFYNGMDALVANYLSFAFPAYVWLLMGITAVAARYNKWPKFMWRFRKNAVPLFSTLILMTYVTTLQNCVEALSGIYIVKIGLRWKVNPSIGYFHTTRIPLIIISVAVIIIYLIPTPILLLFPGLTSRLWIARKMIPIYDVFWAPFREKMHFWVGMRLVLRLCPLVFAYVIEPPLNLLLQSVFLAAYLLVHLTFLPFKFASRNYLDTYLTINLLLIIIGGMYFNMTGTTIGGQLAYMIVFVSTAYLAILAVYSYHFYMAYLKNSKSFNKVQAAVKSKFCLFRNRIQRSRRYNTLSNSSNFSDTIENSSSQVILKAKSKSVANSNYREPLLSDNELTAIPEISPWINAFPTRFPNVSRNAKNTVTTSDLPMPSGEFGELSLQVNTQ